MKKRIGFVIGMVSAAMLMAGCQAKELSNEFATVSQYKGVEIAAIEKTVVTDEDVETQIVSTMESYGESTQVKDRPAQFGDIAEIDYVGTKDGVPFDGGSAEGYGLELGSGTFIPGFEEGIVGHNIGETFDLNLTFPSEYHSQDLAGQDVVFTVTLNGLVEVVVPKLTDEFVASTLSTDAETVDEYREEVAEDLRDAAEESYTTALRDAVWTVVLENTTVHAYPEGTLEKYNDIFYEEYETMAGYYDMEFADFISQYLGMTEEQFAEQVKVVSEMQVKSDLARDLIAEEVKLGTTDEEFEDGYERYAEYYGYDDVETFLKEMEEAGSMDYLHDIILLEMVQDWVADHCKQTK